MVYIPLITLTIHENRKMIHNVGSILATEKQYILKCSHNSCTYVTADNTANN